MPGTPRTTSTELTNPISTALFAPGAIRQSLERLADPMFKDALRDIGVFDLPRFTTGAGNVTTFANGEREVEGVIVHVTNQRVFWGLSAYGTQARPICVARDGQHGEADPLMVEETGIDPVPGGPCLACPYAQFGSLAKLGIQGREKSRASACSATRQIFLYRLGDEQHDLPVMIKCAPSSLKNLRRYQVELMDTSRVASDVVTRVTIEPAHSGGFDFGSLKFQNVANLDEAARAEVRVYAEAIRPWLDQAPVLGGSSAHVCPDCGARWEGAPDDMCPDCGSILEQER